MRRLQSTCNGMCVQATPKSEDVQLIELGYFFQEVLAVRPQSGV